MNDTHKTKIQLIIELAELRQQLTKTQEGRGRLSLRMSEARLYGILRSIDDFVFVLDQVDCFVSAYAPKEDFLGKTIADVMPAHVVERTRELSERNEELRRIALLAADRKIRIKELRDENNKLRAQR